MNTLSHLFHCCLLAASVTFATTASFAQEQDSAINLAKEGQSLVSHVRNLAPYSNYIAAAEAKNAVITFNEFAYKKLNGVNIVVHGLDIEDPKDSDEYKAVGYEAYPFTVKIFNNTDQEIVFDTASAKLTLAGKDIPRTSDEQLKALGEKHKSRFWEYTIKGGLALGAIGVTAATGGASLSALGSGAGTASKLVNNSIVTEIGKELDSDNNLSDYELRKEQKIAANSSAYLYVFFNEFKPKDLSKGAEFTIHVNNKPETFVFHTLTFDDFYDLQYNQK